MIGGLAVNHWAGEPVATADVAVVVAFERVEEALRSLNESGFNVERYEWSINLKGRSMVSVQFAIDPFYSEFPGRAVPADVHGILMRVACLEDTLAGKIRAWSDSNRRPSKRQKDLTDIVRLIETHPSLKDQLSPDLLKKINEI